MLYFGSLVFVGLLYGHPLHQLVLLLTVLPLLHWAGEWRAWWKAFVPFLSLSVMVFVLNLFFVRSGPVLWSLGPLVLYEKAVLFGVAMSLRLVAMGALLALAYRVVSHDELIGTVLRRWGRLGLVLALAVRCYRSLVSDVERIAWANRSRGVGVVAGNGYDRKGRRGWRGRNGWRGLKGRVLRLSHTVTPLVAGSLERAADVADSLECRAFGRRAVLKKEERSVPPRQRWFHIGLGLLLLVHLVLAFLGAGDFVYFVEAGPVTGPDDLLALAAVVAYPITFRTFWRGTL